MMRHPNLTKDKDGLPSISGKTMDTSTQNKPYSNIIQNMPIENKHPALCRGPAPMMIPKPRLGSR